MNQEKDIQRERCFEAFFCTNYKYYMNAYYNYTQKQKLTFNFWAGVFPIMWFVYRKLYYHAGILFMVSYLLNSIFHNILETFFFVFDDDYFISHLILKAILFLPLAFFCNYFYIRKGIKIIYKLNIEVDNQSFNKLLNELRKVGNVNITGILVYILADLLLSIISYL